MWNVELSNCYRLYMRSIRSFFKHDPMTLSTLTYQGRMMINYQLPILGPDAVAQEMRATAEELPKLFIPATLNEDTGNYKMHIPPEQLEGIDKGGLPVVTVLDPWDPDGPAPELPSDKCSPCEEAKKVRSEVRGKGKEHKL